MTLRKKSVNTPEFIIADMLSKRYMVAEALKGGLGVLQGIASHPAGLALLGSIVGVAGLNALKLLYPEKYKLAEETFKASLRRSFWPLFEFER